MGYTRVGRCADASVMCTRRRKWDLTPLARVMYKLVKDAAGRTETNMRKWIETPKIQGPDFSSLMEGIERKVWEKEEELSLMSLALQLLTDWTTTTAINQLSEQLTNLKDHIRPITTNLPEPSQESNQLNTIPLDNDDQIFAEEISPQEIRNWES